MRRSAEFAIAAMLAGAAALNAQPAKTKATVPAPVTPAVATPAAMTPAPAPAPEQPNLISSVVISSMDSPLVRAAKLTVKNRLRDASHSTGVLINDAYMHAHSGGKVSQSFSNVSYGSVGGLNPTQTNAGSPINAPHINTIDRAAVERQQQMLAAEQGRAAAEMGEPYGGNNGMEEDRAEQRSTQIPQQMQQNQQQMNQRP
jgi:hypothetical protein